MASFFPAVSNSGWLALLWLSNQTSIWPLYLLSSSTLCHHPIPSLGLTTSKSRLLTHLPVVPFYSSCGKIYILAKRRPSPLSWSRYWWEWDFSRRGKRKGWSRPGADLENTQSGPMCLQLDVSSVSTSRACLSQALHTSSQVWFFRYHKPNYFNPNLSPPLLSILANRATMDSVKLKTSVIWDSSLSVQTEYTHNWHRYYS